MPLYEFTCKKYGENFEKITSSKTPTAEIKCPACGEYEVRKKFSLFAFDSKGPTGEFQRSPASGGCSACNAPSCASCK